MSLFGFGDIPFDKSSSGERGPLAKLNSSEFERNTYRYPIDLGNYDKAHYVVFYVRMQDTTRYSPTFLDDSLLDEPGGGSGAASVVGNLTAKIPTGVGSQILGKLNSGLSSLNSATGGALSGLTDSISSIAGKAASSVDDLFGQAKQFIPGDAAATQRTIDTSIKKITGGGLGLLKTTKLTKDAIALYMPDTLNYSQSQSYDQLNLGGEALGQFAAAAQSAADEYEKGGSGAARSSIGKSAAMAIGKGVRNYVAEKTGSKQTADAAFTAATGKVQNPMLEMIYRSPNFRSFNFEFTFYPRSEKESLEVQKILERIKFHQAPELAEGTKGFLVPPSEFDIKFYYAGKQNPNIPPISTCILESIDINYAPNGFSAYEVPNENFPSLGRTGMPVAIQVTLQFKETSYLTKEDYKGDVGQTTQA